MGVMSRRVVPVCGNLCVFCPSLRARSRQPVKRYKKLIADIFPRNQVAEPNDRIIGKLCEYASKNPLRIPKITDNLEQRCYKDLRNESFGSVKVVLCIYRKLLSTCKGQMPLFANSLLGIIQTLLEQTRSDEMQILGCNTLVEFIDCQTDGTYMFNLEGFIPKLCQLAHEVGNNEQTLHLRSAGLQALSYMVRYMGEHSHLSMDFDKIISVVLENYLDIQSKSNLAKVEKLNSQSQNQLAQGFPIEGDRLHSLSKKDPSLLNNVTRTETESKLDTAKDPAYWSKVCLYNMAKLAKEASTVRRVLEPLFHNFDIDNHWSSEKGVASCVLIYLQSLLAESGDNSHLLLSILVKHLDHKNVAKQPIRQIDIINTTTQLAQNVKQHTSVAIVGAISDLIKHLRRCLQNLTEASSIGNDAYRLNTELQSALEMCILQLSSKVGDVGPILDLMAVALENIPITTIIARTTISAVYQTAKLITSIPNVSYHNKAFPDALFHQLLLAMAHPDRETQIGAHSVFSMVLMPSMFSPSLDHKTKIAQKAQNVSFSTQHGTFSGAENLNGKLEEGKAIASANGKKYAIHPYGSYGFTPELADRKDDLSSLRLSSHQVSLLLSSIWVQATSVENGPANYEAMAHTYSIALLFTRSKASSYMALVRCFQLAFSLRSISLDQEGGLQPSRRRSLFTLASYMLLFSARAGNVPDLIPKVKASLTVATVDPFLELVDDIRLQAVCIESEKIYGSQEDEVAAVKSLSAVELDDKQLKETVISYFMTKFTRLPEDELSSIKNQLLQGFSPDDAYPSGPPLFMETPRPCSPLAQIEFPNFVEIMAPDDLMDEETGHEHSGSQSDYKTSLSTNYPDVLSVNQLLDSVLETARQVASVSTSSTPLPYDQMKNQCEALVTGKQQKMSVIQSFKHQQEECKAIILSSENEVDGFPVSVKALEYSKGDLKLVTQQQFQARYSSHDSGQLHSLRLPPSSPFDKFLRAAGC
ncbi:protein EFR3 homolog A isoform X1 [Cajanus cajan]|uniref:protein EFR3 homolog A isoform X1 n=3 Tax=Cajanus cajan TaxID=3821 RepID=UPI00098DA362|nr:protein EFR3 homolog A isoform X1 [Cajanus cajan]XP_020223323.1 protein EFR3 homolog A isoform X1 [Cajanus cajan]XP_020223324.1 protein EFR3 homolog A isoform X1 [Cajanus cajan]